MLLLEHLYCSHHAVTDDAFSVDGDAFPSLNHLNDVHCDVFVVVRDYDYCLYWHYLYLLAVSANSFYSSFVDFGTIFSPAIINKNPTLISSNQDLMEKRMSYLTLGQVQIACQFPSLLLGDISIEQEFFL